MEIGISTGIYHDQNIVDVLPLIRDAGFSCVEIWTSSEKHGGYAHFNWHRELEVKKVEVCLRGLNIKTHSIHTPFSENIDLSSPDEIVRAYSVSEVERIMYCMKQLGGEILVVHPSSDKNSLLDSLGIRFAKCRQSLEELYVGAQDLGIKIAIETQLPHIFGGESSSLWQLTKGFSRDVCGFCFDTSHTALWKRGIIPALKDLAMKIISLHISDNNGKSDEHLIPGEGKIDWKDFVHVLKRAVSCEVFMLEISGEERNIKPETLLVNAFMQTKKIISIR